MLRSLYAIGLLGLSVGLCFLTQRLWQIDWYKLFVPIAAIVVLAMAAGVVNHCRTRLVYAPDDEGIRIVDGVWGKRSHDFAYGRIESYRTRPSAWDRRMGALTIVLEASHGVGNREQYEICLSKADAEDLLETLHRRLSA